MAEARKDDTDQGKSRIFRLKTDDEPDEPFEKPFIY
jgi:hypothetical protein